MLGGCLEIGGEIARAYRRGPRGYFCKILGTFKMDDPLSVFVRSSSFLGSVSLSGTRDRPLTERDHCGRHSRGN